MISFISTGGHQKKNSASIRVNKRASETFGNRKLTKKCKLIITLVINKLGTLKSTLEKLGLGQNSFVSLDKIFVSDSQDELVGVIEMPKTHSETKKPQKHRFPFKKNREKVRFWQSFMVTLTDKLIFRKMERKMKVQSVNLEHVEREQKGK